MPDRPNLWLCFPYRGVGGVSLLFQRIGDELARRGLADVTLVDYADGYMARHHDPALTHLAAYSDDGGLAVPADAVLVLQSMSCWSIYPGLRPAPDTRVLLWNCHPYNLVPTLPGARAFSQRPLPGKLLRQTVLRGFRARLRRYATLMLDRRSLIFMDEPNLRITRDALGLAIPKPTMVPIAGPAATSTLRSPPVGDTLNMLWIGRIVDFKQPILTRAMIELDRHARATGRSIRVTIVGGGDHEARLRRDVAGLTALDIVFLGERTPGELEALLQATDALMAMGTSALEGARLGVPTLLLDFSYGPVPPSYQFAWLYQRSGFTLGDEASLRRGPRGSLDLRIAELDADPAGVGAASRAYFERHHSLSVVAERLNGVAGQAACRWGDLQDAGLFGRGYLYSAFAAVRKRFLRP